MHQWRARAEREGFERAEVLRGHEHKTLSEQWPVHNETCVVLDLAGICLVVVNAMTIECER